jgi:hypothetical protein
VESYHGKVTYLVDVVEPPAEQFRESAAMTDEDFDFQEHTWKKVTGEENGFTLDD